MTRFPRGDEDGEGLDTEEVIKSDVGSGMVENDRVRRRSRHLYLKKKKKNRKGET